MFYFKKCLYFDQVNKGIFNMIRSLHFKGINTVMLKGGGKGTFKLGGKCGGDKMQA